MENKWLIRFARILFLILGAATVFILYRIFFPSGWSGIAFIIAGITGIIALVFLLQKDRDGSKGKQKRLAAIALVWCLPVLCISISHTYPAADRISMIAIWVVLVVLALSYTFKRMVLDRLPTVPAQ